MACEWHLDKGILERPDGAAVLTQDQEAPWDALPRCCSRCSSEDPRGPSGLDIICFQETAMRAHVTARGGAEVLPDSMAAKGCGHQSPRLNRSGREGHRGALPLS